MHVHVLIHINCHLGAVQILEFKFELLSDMTVVPQQYTLHCVSTGDGYYSITLYGNDQQIYSGGCRNGVCIKGQLHSSNYTYDNTVTITWNTQTISSGQLFSQSVNGDQIFRCNVVRHDANRNHNITVKGIKNYYLYYTCTCIFLSSRIHSFSSY